MDKKKYEPYGRSFTEVIRGIINETAEPTEETGAQNRTLREETGMQKDDTEHKVE